MLLSKLAAALTWAGMAYQAVGMTIAGRPNQLIHPYKRGEPLQDIVTWDKRSLFVRGERIMFFSGELLLERCCTRSKLGLAEPISAAYAICIDTRSHGHSRRIPSISSPCSFPVVRRLSEDQVCRVQWGLVLCRLGKSLVQSSTVASNS